jgi:hypothetical protein
LPPAPATRCGGSRALRSRNEALLTELTGSRSLRGHAEGYLIEAGHQAFAIDAAKAERKRWEIASGALQLAVSDGLGFGGVLTSAAQRVSGRVKDVTLGKALDQGFRAAFTRLGQDAFNEALRMTTRGGDAIAAQWGNFKDDLGLHLQGQAEARLGYRQGVLDGFENEAN